MKRINAGLAVWAAIALLIGAYGCAPAENTASLTVPDGMESVTFGVSGMV